MDQGRNSSAVAMPRLGLFDAVSLIVGIIVGVGIFEVPWKIFAATPGPWVALSLWLLAGLLALVGALCFAELAAAYPRSGGEYVYLTRAYGSATGFLFAWTQLALIRPCGIAALAFIFAKNAANLWDLGSSATFVVAILVVAVPTVINILGVTFGKTTQNLLTVAKVLALAAIILAGFALGKPASEQAVVRDDLPSHWFAWCMIFVFWTYGGWHEAAYVAAEVKNNRRNLPLALILGALIVTAIYLLVNAAIWLGLGLSEARLPSAAADVVALLFPRIGGQAMNVLIMVSALGAINGQVFTTSRLFAEFGGDHRLFTPLAQWSRLQTPARSVAAVGLTTLAFVVGVILFGQGKYRAHQAAGATHLIGQDLAVQAVAPAGTPITAAAQVAAAVKDTRLDAYAPIQSGFDVMIGMTAAAFSLFFLLTGLALFRLRALDPLTHRPFRVPGYPALPLLFCAWCVILFLNSLLSSFWLSLLGLVLVVAGLPLYFLPKKLGKSSKVPELVSSLRSENARESCANP